MPKVTKTKRVKRQKKNCYFTESNTSPDYKDILILKRFLSERGKILPSAYSGVTAKHQRKLSKELKKARFMALIRKVKRHGAIVLKISKNIISLLGLILFLYK